MNYFAMSLKYTAKVQFSAEIAGSNFVVFCI